jgi:amino acid adenylation domain-containing protein
LEESYWKLTESVRVTQIEFHERINYPIGLIVAPGEKLLLRILYDLRRFEREGIRRMLLHLEQLLEGMARDPEQRVGDLELLTEGEREELLEGRNATAQEYPRHKCVHQLFEEQAERSPEAVAVVAGQREVSYRELNERSNALAHHLRELGVGPEVRVGICVERSIEMVVGLLGIWKAGGAFVPLDPVYPRERLEYMIGDAGVGLVLTQQRLVERLAGVAGQLLCLDEEPIEGKRIDNPESQAVSDNLAYVMYTSGSTGKPKGVLIPHNGLCNVVIAQHRCFSICATDRVLQFASLSFDACVFEILAALNCGATLFLAPPKFVPLGEEFATFLRTQEISVAVLTPSMLASMSDDPLPKLRILITAGEACYRSLVVKWSRDRSMYNAYGPTEATIWATLASLEESQSHVTIGRPIANTQVFVLDSRLAPVPTGVIGELYIAGVGLARGYDSLPSLTAEHFVPNPFSHQAGARMYKSGDLVRYLDNGSLEFVGRDDRQIKIRGYRIELSEIEAALLEHPRVSQAAVLSSEGTSVTKQLVAYVSPGGVPPTMTELRDFLGFKLPPYMLPSAFVIIEEMPLTINGKINRNALSTLGRSDLFSVLEGELPSDSIEKTIATIWMEVLNIRSLRNDTNFFEAGGHSLLLVQVHRQLKEALKREIPMVDLFEFPSISSLARRLRETHGDKLLCATGSKLADERRAALERRRNFSPHRRGV